MLDLSQKEIIISWSGGKDSTASILLALENGVKISRICHVDMRYDDETPAILPEHYEFMMEAAEICKKHNLLSPIYNVEGIKRDGCFFCPNCSRGARSFVKQKHPNLLPKIWELFRLCNFPAERWQKMRRHKWFSDWLEAEAWEG